MPFLFSKWSGDNVENKIKQEKSGFGIRDGEGQIISFISSDSPEANLLFIRIELKKLDLAFWPSQVRMSSQSG